MPVDVAEALTLGDGVPSPVTVALALEPEPVKVCITVPGPVTGVCGTVGPPEEYALTNPDHVAAVAGRGTLKRVAVQAAPTKAILASL